MLFAVEFGDSPVSDGTARRITAFFEQPVAGSESRRLSDHLRLDLYAVLGGTSSPGWIGVLATDPDARGDAPRGYAQLSTGARGAVMEVIAERDDLKLALLDTALDAQLAASHTTEVTWWTDDASPELHRRASQRGLRPDRTLIEMRRPLPAERRSTIATRSFEVGVDEEAFLTVNNRAFEGHGEQAGWNPETLELRKGESWFDPDGFLLYETDHRLAGFCWTKIHAPTEQQPAPVGEIYVIAVDPTHSGQGLGTELTLAGLDFLSDRGVSTAMLYVDADNTAAVKLYERLGFAPYRSRRSFSGVPTPSGAGAGR